MVRKKVAKGYAPPLPHLLVFFTLSAEAITYEPVREAVEVGGGMSFASAWVMTPTHLLCVKPLPGQQDPPHGWWPLPITVNEGRVGSGIGEK
jgi:hypothetical protein